MKNLLKQKDLTPTDKLIILYIEDNMLFNECNQTTQEIGSALGLSRKKVIDTLDKLVEMDLIKTKVNGQFRERKTKFTQRLKHLLNDE